MIRKETEGKIKKIALCKQPANSLDIFFLKKIYTCLKETEQDNNIHGVILSSENKSVFSSGLDLRKLTSVPEYSKENIFKAVWLVHKIVKLIINSKKIYTAAISGSVIGSAASIVLACDFRFSSKFSWFWLPDPQYGGLLADGGIDIIRSICGTSMAKMLCIANERIDIDCAYKAGLINKILDIDMVDDHARYFTSRVISNSMVTIAKTKRIVNKGMLKPFPFVKLLQIINSKEMAQRLVKFNLYGDER